jgi:cation transport regulator
VPYVANGDLPPPVRHVLPEHAQDIYRAAFNHAWDQHHGRDEAAAHRIAWAAVKRSYRKVDGVWTRRTKKPAWSL